MNMLSLLTSRGGPTNLLEVIVRTHAGMAIYAGLALAVARSAILYVTEGKVPHVLIDLVMFGMVMAAYSIIVSAPGFIVARLCIWWFNWQNAQVYAGLGALVVLLTTIYAVPGGENWLARYALAIVFGAFAGLVLWKREQNFVRARLMAGSER